jgi:hypothetical protein
MLRNAGAIDVDFYERKLRQNAGNHAQVINHLSEANVALMVLENGAKATMRDSPDLKIEWLGVVFYAEVKHFNRNEQDRRDEAAMRSARGEFVMDGDIRQSEGSGSYEQMSDAARKKTPQYVDGAINILVIDSSSESMDSVDVMALSGMREYDEELRKTPHDVALRRLHGTRPTDPGLSRFAKGSLRQPPLFVQTEPRRPANDRYAYFEDICSNS